MRRMQTHSDTELFQRANIEEPLEENLCGGYCHLLSVIWCRN